MMLSRISYRLEAADNTFQLRPAAYGYAAAVARAFLQYLPKGKHLGFRDQRIELARRVVHASDSVVAMDTDWDLPDIQIETLPMSPLYPSPKGCVANVDSFRCMLDGVVNRAVDDLVSPRTRRAAGWFFFDFHAAHNSRTEGVREGDPSY